MVKGIHTRISSQQKLVSSRVIIPSGEAESACKDRRTESRKDDGAAGSYEGPGDGKRVEFTE